jgi:hypothetical protein
MGKREVILFYAVQYLRFDAFGKCIRRNYLRAIPDISSYVGYSRKYFIVTIIFL